MYKLQNKSTILGNKSNANFDWLAFENQTVSFEKPVFWRFRVRDLSKLQIWKNFHNILKPKIERLELQYLDIDSFFISFKIKNIIKNLD